MPNSSDSTRSDYDRLTAESGRTALAASLLISGGAAVAFLAFLGDILADESLNFSQDHLENFGLAMICFFVGAYLSASASGTAYLSNFLSYRLNKPSWGIRCIWWTIGNAMASLAFSVVGVCLAAWPFIFDADSILTNK